MLNVCFNSYGKYTVNYLYQWDKNQIVEITGLNLSKVPEVHFANKTMEKAIVRQATMADGVIRANIPNSLLQAPFPVIAFVGIYEGKQFKTIETIKIPIVPRVRPADYVLEKNDDEVYSFAAMENAIANMVTQQNFDRTVANLTETVESNKTATDSQIANIIAHNNDTEGNTELIDVRTGSDGTVYESAGMAVRAQTKQIAEEIDRVSNIKEKFKGVFDSVFVNNGVLQSNNDSKSVIVKMAAGAKYDIKAYGTFNRFRIYAANSATEGTTPVEVYKKTPGKYEEFIFLNNESYKILIVFLDYNSDNFDCDLSIIETLDNKTFNVNGIPVFTKESGQEAINDSIKEAIPFWHGFGPISNYGANNDSKTLILNDLYKGCIIKVDKGEKYTLIVKGNHNRFIVSGVIGTIDIGATTEQIKANESTKATDKTETFMYENSKYDYLVINLAYDLNDFSATVEIVRGDDKYEINGVEFAPKNELYTKQEIDDLEFKYFYSDTNNLFDIKTAKLGISIASSSGEEVALENCNSSDYIPVEAGEKYIFSTRHTIAFYDEKKNFISGISSTDATNPITIPDGVYYLRFAYKTTSYLLPQINKGTKLLDYDDGSPKLNHQYLPDIAKKKYKLEYETIKLSNGLNAKPHNLALISIKNVYGTSPEYEAFLFFDAQTNKLYIADSAVSNIEYLCDWNLELSNNVSCFEYLTTITADGDIIFFRKYMRENPIIYPHTNYHNPIRIDFGDNLKPYGFLTSVSVVHFSDGSFVFGDYTNHKLVDEQNNDPRCIWHVTKPYTDVENWKVAHRFKHVYYTSPESDEPDNEIGHIHTVAYDFYADTLYCTTGDIDRHCRVYRSKDKGVTWSHVVTGGQKYRSVGLTFRKDACFYGTDSFYHQHELYKAERGDDGEVDFTNIKRVCSLEPLNRNGSQATYGTILLRNPNGLLFLDRAEPREDNLLDIPFYSFDDEKLYMTATFGKKLFNIDPNRNGLCNQCFTDYQPATTDFVVCGGGSVIRHNTTDILNNSADNYIGVLKLKVVLDSEI